MNKSNMSWMLSFLLLAGVLLSSCLRQDDRSDTLEEQADYTLIIYGSMGGNMEYSSESIFEETKSLLTDKKVRVYVVYKYGMDDTTFVGKYGLPGQVVSFELDKDTELENLRNPDEVMKDYPLYDPKSISAALDNARKCAPAKDYVLVLFGHGGGFNPLVDYPKTHYYSTRGVVSDDYLKGMLMNMYELSQGIEESDIPHLKAIIFHNCLMGGMESMFEMTPYADYIIGTPFMLTSEDGPLVPNLIKQLRTKSDFESAARQAIIDSKERLRKAHLKESVLANGNVELIKVSNLQGVCDVTRALADRICELYPVQKEAVDSATCKTYQFLADRNNYDLLDYSRQLARETSDDSLQALYMQMDRAFSNAIIKQVSIDMDTLFTLPSYSMSVLIVDSVKYHSDSPLGSFTYGESYEMCGFHKATGWGKWLGTNLCAPTGNPVGQVFY